MAFDPVTAIADLIKTVVEKAADRFLPASMSEAEKEDFKLKSRAIAVDEYKTVIADMQGARELAMKETEGSPGWTKVLTVTHRPLWSFAMLGIFGWTILAPYLGWPIIALSEIHKDIMQTVIIFYFGGRSIEKVASTIKEK